MEEILTGPASHLSELPERDGPWAGRGGAQELREEPSPGPGPDSKQKQYSRGPKAGEVQKMAKLVRTVPSSGEMVQVGT